MGVRGLFSLRRSSPAVVTGAGGEDVLNFGFLGDIKKLHRCLGYTALMVLSECDVLVCGLPFSQLGKCCSYLN